MDIVEKLRKRRIPIQYGDGWTDYEDDTQSHEAADEIERLRKVLQEIADKDGWCSAKAVAKRLREAGYVDINTIYKMAEEAADEIERLRKVNVMQARWLHEAHENHKLFKDKVRQLLSVESAALKDGE